MYHQERIEARNTHALMILTIIVVMFRTSVLYACIYVCMYVCMGHIITIPTPESHRDLGVMVRGDLSWTNHYSHICSKAYSVLYMIRRSFSTVDVVVNVT